MSENKRIVGIVPARGGSKSIPRKNVKLLGGIPLIAYSIEAGLRSKYLDRVIVSTDDPEIAAVAREWGAEVPFMRPAELAGDLATDLPVFEHALRWLEEEGYRCDAVVQLRPTSPFRPPACVDEAVEVLLSGNADSVRGITPSGQNPYKMWRIEDGMMQPLLDSEFAEPYNMPRQELPDTFWQTGHVEVIRTATILEMGSMTGHRIAPYVLDPAYAIDLDNELQWKFAEYVLDHWKLEIVKPNSSTK
ncbi:MAG: acylneuraminate cytidylyltransferase family protein [Saprospiraceae bacterium]|nr:acylneuraminate cytidylyltransferase family protein [Saprospiraceae bacterium]MCB0682657.1 acylneuraminate cytidylyltransferase family protein [Saprospiraceae bacterium]